MAEFWRNIKPRRQSGLVSRFMRDLQSGFFQLPRGLDVLTRYRTERLQLQHSTAPVRLKPPEHRTMLHFYRQYPEAKLEPISLDSFDAPIAKQFALRQLQLLEDDRARQRQRKELRTRLLMEGHRGAALVEQLQALSPHQPPLTARQAAQQVTAEMSHDLERIRQREVLVTGMQQVQAEEEEQIRFALQETLVRSGELPPPAGQQQGR